MYDFDLLAKQLTPYYSYFRVGERLLFTAHSHQAWPDVAFEGQKASFTCAADHLDQKWSHVFRQMDRLRGYLRSYYRDNRGYYSFSSSTYELLVRWLSALDLRARPHIITTDGEFYTIARQLLRLEEEGLEVTRVPLRPTSEIAARMQSAISSRTVACICSHVFYTSSLVHSSIYELAEVAERHDLPLLIDDYHATNVRPLDLRRMPHVYLLGGGYKYLQWGEGNAFLRFPKSSELRPLCTGWFASFNDLEEGDYREGGRVRYDEGDMRFAGATYDPTSCFRAAKVVEFFEQQSLDAQRLEAQYRAQMAYMMQVFLDLDFAPEVMCLLDERSSEARGAFLSLRSPYAVQIQLQLHKAGVHTDVRGDVLRFGVAPYTQRHQIQEAFHRLGTIVSALR